ncbi:MAG: homoserine dehydrogenase [Eubacteriales bacterium]|nr:homoserine dehydrogenase [Eubacteriales bacterium]
MKIGVLGYGVVGKGVDLLLQKNRDLIARKTGFAPEVNAVLCLETSEDERFCNDIEDFMARDFTVVAEAMGGVEPAFTYVKRCLEAGHSVVTSNKALICDRGAELFAIARANRVGLYYEASVGGVIPVIKTLRDNLAQDDVHTVAGILNGTTNYIFSVMLPEDGSEGISLDAAIRRAQELGYAEADPAADVEGHDAARKIAIIASLLTGCQVGLSDVDVRGILDITEEDVAVCKSVGYKIKLIAEAKIDGTAVSARVRPMFVAPTHPLYHIDGVTNAVVTESDMAGEIMLTGAGAGRFPTASAVVSDIVYALASDYASEADCDLPRACRHRDFGWSEKSADKLAADASKTRYICSVRSPLPDCRELAKAGRETIVLTEPLTEEELKAHETVYGIRWCRAALV